MARLSAPGSGKKTVYAPDDVNLHTLRLLSTPGGDDERTLMHCSGWETRATGLEPGREAVEASGVPVRPGARARAPLEGACLRSGTDFSRGKRGR